jgi:hypothetical protein
LRIASGQCRGNVTTHVAGDARAVVVIDTGEIEAHTLGIDAHVLIAQHRHVEIANEGHPRVGVREVIVIAGDEEHAMPRPQGAQRCDVGTHMPHRAVDEIPGDGDEIRRQRVATADEVRREAVIEQRPEVDVADLDDAKAIELSRPTCKRDLDAAESGWAQHRDQANGAENRGERRYEQSALPVHCRRISTVAVAATDCVPPNHHSASVISSPTPRNHATPIQIAAVHAIARCRCAGSRSAISGWANQLAPRSTRVTNISARQG